MKLFLQSGDFDPIIDGTVVQKDSYFNVDIGASYNYLDFYMHGTVKCHRNQKEYLHQMKVMQRKNCTKTPTTFLSR
jgi:hypothetical protein